MILDGRLIVVDMILDGRLIVVDMILDGRLIVVDMILDGRQKCNLDFYDYRNTCPSGVHGLTSGFI
jgi:hypothetical protein